jgi:hypothetical protein
MIAFVTLLLGLISGVYPIEVKVGGPVAAVEMTLDGAAAGRVTGPPWLVRVDLGRDLRPHRLVARALDAQGAEISRVEQWLNLPRPPAEVEVVLEKGPDGIPRAAVLTWQSVSGVKPASLGLTLDDRPLIVGPDGRTTLPATDLKELHVITAEVWFPPGQLARRDVVFGGQYGSEVSAELTAVPVRLTGGGPLPPAEKLAGWFTAGGQPVAADAVEEGPGKVAAVCVPTGTEILDKLVPPRKRTTALQTFRTEMRLGLEDRFHFLSLSSTPFRGSPVPAELFQMSLPLTPADGGVFWFLTDKRMARDPKGSPRIADAVAVAGLQAAAENHRRAVVLVLGRDVEDSSRHDPATVRRYLESIHVPLFVWSLYGTDTRMARDWGPVEDISAIPRLSDAVRRLRTELDRQRIVWLDGRHLPATVALTAEAKGVEIVEAAAP